MPVSEICNRQVVFVQRHETALEAARLMRQHHVGDVVVVEEQAGIRKPIGIITDRDLVVEIIAPEIDPASFTAGDVMSPELAAVQEDTGVFEAIQFMRAKGVRRLPVVDSNGGLIGILALDDLLELLAEELTELSKLVKYEHKKETMTRG